MKEIVKFLISGTIIAGGSGVTWKAYDEFAPKTAEDWFNWKGIKKVSTEQEYRGIFEENKNDTSELKIEGLNTNSDISEAAKKLKEWCETKLKQPSTGNDWETIIKFCELKFSTVKGMLLSKNEKEFITKEEDYKVALFFLKRKQDWQTKIKKNNQEIDHNKLKEWCEDQLSKTISNSDKSLYSGINAFCKVPRKNTVEAIIKEKETNWTLTNSEWKDVFNTWKYTKSFMNLLKKEENNESISETTPNEEGGPKLKDWCEKGKNKKLAGDIEDSYINHIKIICSYTISTEQTK